MTNGDALAATLMALNQRLKSLEGELKELHTLLDGIVGKELTDGTEASQKSVRVRSRTHRSK